MSGWKDITGKKFGHLTAIRYLGKSKWLCSCSCGGQAICLACNLKSGNSTSCGCIALKNRRTHGMSHEPEYRIWIAMKSRCQNPDDASYYSYGGRGIKVCERWTDSFINFFFDMGKRPKGYEIDRMDNEDNYCPKNCRWVPKNTNLNNRRDSNKVIWNGVVKTIAEWSKYLDIHEETLRHRINRGWTVERAFTTPVRRKKPANYSMRDRSDRKVKCES